MEEETLHKLKMENDKIFRISFWTMVIFIIIGLIVSAFNPSLGGGIGVMGMNIFLLSLIYMLEKEGKKWKIKNLKN